MKPMILISPDDAYDQESHRPLYLSKRSYTTAISGAGGLAVMPVDPRLYDTYAELAQGLLLADGNDTINPARFGEAIGSGGKPRAPGAWYDFNIGYTRDSMDITLCRAFLKAGKPILGLGRGMHIINTVLGGTLYQTLQTHYEKEHPVGKSHAISIRSGSQLEKLLGNGCKVNSYHHQGIKTLGEGLEAAAWSKDGLVEAVWHKTLPVFGVEWNPELELSNDEEWMQKNSRFTGDPEMDPDLAARFRKRYELMKPMPGAPTDLDLVLSKDNPLFNYFVSLCKEEVKE